MAAAKSKDSVGSANCPEHARPSSDHLFIGSGVIEAGCKTVIGSRLKRFAMEP
jgi:hypothetical protein